MAFDRLIGKHLIYHRYKRWDEPLLSFSPSFLTARRVQNAFYNSFEWCEIFLQIQIRPTRSKRLLDWRQITRNPEVEPAAFYLV